MQNLSEEDLYESLVDKIILLDVKLTFFKWLWRRKLKPQGKQIITEAILKQWAKEFYELKMISDPTLINLSRNAKRNMKRRIENAIKEN